MGRQRNIFKYITFNVVMQYVTISQGSCLCSSVNQCRVHEDGATLLSTPHFASRVITLFASCFMVRIVLLSTYAFHQFLSFQAVALCLTDRELRPTIIGNTGCTHSKSLHQSIQQVQNNRAIVQYMSRGIFITTDSSNHAKATLHSQ